MPMLHAGRCIPAEKIKPSYLVLGMFKTSAEHPGFPDKRWLTLSELKAAEGMQIGTFQHQIDKQFLYLKSADQTLEHEYVFLLQEWPDHHTNGQ